MLGLTYRQVACLYERYWDRQVWDLEVQAAMNPFGGEKKPGPEDSMEEIFNQPAIDITAPGSDAFLSEMGIKVRRRAKKG